MRFKFFGMVAGGLMLAMTPAAASAAEIDCIIERTPAPLKAEVDAIAAKIVADSQGTPGGERSIAGKLEGQLTSCTATHGWSAAKGKAAMDFAIASLLRGVLSRNLAENRISMAAIERVVAANPAVFKSEPGSTPTEAQRDKVLEDARAAGLPTEAGGVGDLVLTYFGAIAVLAQIVAEFDAA